MDPTGVYLKDHLDDTMYFPGDNGVFRLPEEGVLPFSTLLVEGRSLGQGSAARTTSVVTSNSQAASSASSLSSSSPYQGTSSSMLQSMVARRPPPSFTLKVVKAKVAKGGNKKPKLIIKSKNQMFIQLIESTANVGSITTAARENWGVDITIVTGDGLKIDDSPATRGM